ncbi:MAG: hypothetical protein V4725_17345 [Bacteroidota bacterium]
MKDFALKEQMNLVVTARFIAKGSDVPVTGKLFSVRLYDKDVFGDDFLGESKLNEQGEASILVDSKAFSDLFNIEALPDFYFVLYNNQVPIFTSKVMEDIDVENLNNFTPGTGGVVDLGTFLVAI